jgi:cytoskeletal protein RodZ
LLLFVWGIVRKDRLLYEIYAILVTTTAEVTIDGTTISDETTISPPVQTTDVATTTTPPAQTTAAQTTAPNVATTTSPQAQTTTQDIQTTLDTAYLGLLFYFFLIRSFPILHQNSFIFVFQKLTKN